MAQEESATQEVAQPEINAAFSTIEAIETMVKKFTEKIWKSKNLGEESVDLCTAINQKLSCLHDEINTVITKVDERLEGTNSALEKAQKDLRNTNGYVARLEARSTRQIREDELREISEALQEIVRDIPDAKMRACVGKLANFLENYDSSKKITRTDLRIATL